MRFWDLGESKDKDEVERERFEVKGRPGLCG